MSDNFPTCVAFTLQEEGGYSDDPRDPGGATNMGITLETLTHWRGEPCTAADVQALDQNEAEAIYHGSYWNTCACDALPVGVDLMIFDFGVNAGPGRSARQLQAILGVAQDGMIGPKTIGATTDLGIGLVIQLQAAHETYYRSRDGFATFGAGWLARLNRCAALARTMINS